MPAHFNFRETSTKPRCTVEDIKFAADWINPHGPKSARLPNDRHVTREPCQPPEEGQSLDNGTPALLELGQRDASVAVDEGRV